MDVVFFLIITSCKTIFKVIVLHDVIIKKKTTSMFYKSIHEKFMKA